MKKEKKRKEKYKKNTNNNNNAMLKTRVSNQPNPSLPSHKTPDKTCKKYKKGNKGHVQVLGNK
jgi:hypothetical protein